MKALGCREAKRNSAVSGQGRVKARNGCRNQGCGLAGAFAGRQVFGGRMFDGHFGIHEVVQTVTDTMTASRSEYPVLEQ
jgi:hypothetical protein